MTDYFISPSGSDANNGLSKAAPLATFNHFEAVPPAGDDNLIIFPGTYRQTGTTAASGTSGHPITYIGDEGGTLTDGIGGAIRITGSDDDLTVTRANAIFCANNYRTFQGIHADTTSSSVVSVSGGNVTLDRCVIGASASALIAFSGASIAGCQLKRCILQGTTANACVFTHSSTVDNSGCVVENCFFLGFPNSGGISITRIGGLTIRNNTFIGGNVAIRVTTGSPSVGQVNAVNDNQIMACITGMSALATSDLTEDYNNIFACSTARTNVTAGANSQAYPPLLGKPLLTLGVGGVIPGMLTAQSALASIAGTGVASDDLYGQVRAVTSSWGAVQFQAGFYLAGVQRWRWERTT